MEDDDQLTIQLDPAHSRLLRDLENISGMPAKEVATMGVRQFAHELLQSIADDPEESDERRTQARRATARFADSSEIDDAERRFDD